MLNAICGTLLSLIIVNSIDVCSLLVHDVGFLNAKIFQFQVGPSFGIPQKAFTSFDCVDLQATFAFSLDFFMIRLNLKAGRVQLFPFFIVLAALLFNCSWTVKSWFASFSVSDSCFYWQFCILGHCITSLVDMLFTKSNN